MICKMSKTVFPHRLRKAKEIVPDGEHLRIEQEGSTMTLTVSDVTLQDAGLYVCVLTNSAGSCKCSAELLVEGELAAVHCG